MTKQNLPLLIISVNQAGISLFAPNLSDIIQVEYPPETVKELEVINSKNIKTMIENAVSQYQIPKSQVAIILNNSVYFEKEIVPQENGQTVLLEQQFSESVPLESVFVRKFKFNNQLKMIAFNKMFYKSLVRSLNELGFTPKIIVPDLVIDEVLGVSELTIETAQLISNSLDKLKKYNLLSPDSTSKPVTKPVTPNAASTLTPTQTSNKSESKKRLYMLIGTFAFLILIMIGMAVKTFILDQPQI